MAKQKKPHYVDNKEFLRAMVEWKDECKKMIDADSRVIFHNGKYERRNPIDQIELF